jgi:phosphatidylglycerol lysyltransferase
VRRKHLVYLPAFICLLSGIINLESLFLPVSSERLKLLEDLFSYDIIFYSRGFILTSGFFFILLSHNLFKKKRAAWILAVLLNIFSIFFHLTKGLDYEEALFNLFSLLILIWWQKEFTVRSDFPSILKGLLGLGLSVGLALLYGTLGFFILDKKHFGIDFSLNESLEQVINLYLFDFASQNLVPATRFGRWFLHSIYLIGALSVGYSVWSLFRPVVWSLSSYPHEHELAKKLLKQSGQRACDFFKTYWDKSFLFNKNQSAFLAFKVGNHVALALDTPVTNSSKEANELVITFLQQCKQNDWTPAFYQVAEADINAFKKVGLKTLKIGEEAILDLADLKLALPKYKDMRQVISRTERQNISFTTLHKPVVSQVLKELKQVSDEWLSIPNRSERVFSMGVFEENYLNESLALSLCRSSDQKLLAFVNVISVNSHEAAIDLMRRKNSIPNGLMEYLIVKTALWLQEKGYRRLSLGLTPLSGIENPENIAEASVKFFYENLNRFYNYKGLRLFKNKFKPRWEPRYLAYENNLLLPKIALGLLEVMKPNNKAHFQQDLI